MQIKVLAQRTRVWTVTATDTSNYNHCVLGNGVVGIRTHKSGLKTNEIYINGLAELRADSSTAPVASKNYHT